MRIFISPIAPRTLHAAQRARATSASLRRPGLEGLQHAENGITCKAARSLSTEGQALLRAHASESASSSLVAERDEALDGVDQWAALVAGERSARRHIAHNINSDLFGSAGALRIGEYKLIVEARVSESEIYEYGQHMLQDDDWDLKELSQVRREHPKTRARVFALSARLRARARALRASLHVGDAESRPLPRLPSSSPSLLRR